MSGSIELFPLLSKEFLAATEALENLLGNAAELEECVAVLFALRFVIGVRETVGVYATFTLCILAGPSARSRVRRFSDKNFLDFSAEKTAGARLIE